MGAFLDGPAHSKCLEIAKKRRRLQRAFLAKIKNLKVQEQRPFPETCSKQCLIFSSAKYNHIYIEMYCIFLFLLYWSVYPRVVRGDINFKIQRDPSDFLFLIDPYGPYLIEFSFENGSFLLTKALFWVNFCPFRATGRKGRG